MSSPVRSPAPVSATGGGAADLQTRPGAVSSSCHIPVTSSLPRTAETRPSPFSRRISRRRSTGEVKTLDRDSWMFAAQIQIHLIFRPGKLSPGLNPLPLLRHRSGREFIPFEISERRNSGEAIDR
ncbi:unnamed protein product [Spirodela intermedia]|uniref:Uncharacterized protein n=1 Tax=Spirodela intermedia TaxID=51605 RepID=A0ABN7ECB1_SPIIN|nr:unnamed protein product [Spirodela intermedia]